MLRLHFYIGVLALLSLVFAETASAQAKQIIAIVEAPFVDPQAPPKPEQFDRAVELQDSLSERILKMQFDGYQLTDGRAALESGNKQAFNDAQMLFQVLLTVSTKGFKADAQLYNRERGSWVQVAKKISGDISTKPVDAVISDAVLPELIVKVLELSRSQEHPILFADCLFVAPGADMAVKNLALSASQRYANRLLSDTRLVARFGVVRLVPLVQADVQWWCSTLDRPRMGTIRDDTITVHGFLEAMPTPEVSIVVSKRDRHRPNRDMIPIDVRNWPDSMQRISDAVEGLTRDDM